MLVCVSVCWRVCVFVSYGDMRKINGRPAPRRLLYCAVYSAQHMNCVCIRFTHGYPLNSISLVRWPRQNERKRMRESVHNQPQHAHNNDIWMGMPANKRDFSKFSYG